MFYDFMLSAIFAFIATIFHNVLKVPEGSKESLFHWPLDKIIIEGIFIVGIVFFLCKGLFIDIKYWSPKLFRLFEYLRR